MMKFIKQALTILATTLLMSPGCAFGCFVNHTLKFVSKKGNKTCVVLHVKESDKHKGITPKQIAQIACEKKDPIFLSDQDGPFFKKIATSCKKEKVKCSNLFVSDKLNEQVKKSNFSFAIVSCKKYKQLVKLLTANRQIIESFQKKGSSEALNDNDIRIFSGLSYDIDDHLTKQKLQTNFDTQITQKRQTKRKTKKLSKKHPYIWGLMSRAAIVLGLCSTYIIHKYKLCKTAKIWWRKWWNKK